MTWNKPRSDARARPTPTTRAQNVALSSTVARVAAWSQSPKSSQIVHSDTAKEHEDAGDDVGRGRDAHLRRLLVCGLQEEARRDVFVLEQVRKPISKRSKAKPVYEKTGESSQ